MAEVGIDLEESLLAQTVFGKTSKGTCETVPYVTHGHGDIFTWEVAQTCGIEGAESEAVGHEEIGDHGVGAGTADQGASGEFQGGCEAAGCLTEGVRKGRKGTFEQLGDVMENANGPSEAAEGVVGRAHGTEVPGVGFKRRLKATAPPEIPKVTATFTKEAGHTRKGGETFKGRECLDT